VTPLRSLNYTSINTEQLSSTSYAYWLHDLQSMPSCFLVSHFELFRVTRVSRGSLVLKYCFVGYLYLCRHGTKLYDVTQASSIMLGGLTT
jgi:hypothetical protein